jgi:hypothetical protein
MEGCSKLAKMKNQITVIAKSNLKGKLLRVNYRSSERFIIKEELPGGRIIALCNNGIEYCFDLSDNITILD